MEEHLFETVDGGIRFEYTGDRWQHTIFAKTDGAEPIVVASVEGSPDDPCPASPAFQELRVERAASPGRSADGPNVCVVQMFGQAGGQIYSAAVEINTDEGTLDFDVCLRARTAQAIDAARSTYQFGAGVDFAATVDGGRFVAAQAVGPTIGRTLSVATLASPPARCELLSERRICLKGVSGPAQGGGQTVRWRYRLSWRASA